MIELAHKVIREQIRKYRAAYKSPAEIDNALYRGLIDFYNDLFKSKQNSQQLTRYLKEQECNISGSNSFVLNSDFSKPANIYSVVSGQKYEGDLLSENEWLDRIQSLIIFPDLQNPIARIVGGSIEFYPEDAGNFTLVYYRSPLKPAFNFTIAGNGRDITYNPVGSVQLDINEPAFDDVIVRALGYLGVSLNDQGLLVERQLNGN
jgi:hypothetical protein